MSLIPSESLNFPDSFRTKVGWRVAENEQDAKALEALQQAISNGQSGSAAQPAASSPSVTEIRPAPPEVVASAMLPAAAESVQTDDPPGEPIPQPPTAPDPSQPLTSMAEMSALLSHFLSSAATPKVPVDMPNDGVATLSPEPPLIANNPVIIPGDQSLDPPTEKIATVDQPVTTAPESAPAAEPTPANQPGLTEPGPAAPVRTPPRKSFRILPDPAINGLDALAEPVAPLAPTPAQPNNFFDLIAAAVQRGTLIAEPVAGPAPAASPPVIPQAEPQIFPSSAEIQQSSPEIPLSSAEILPSSQEILPSPEVSPSSQEIAQALPEPTTIKLAADEPIVSPSSVAEIKDSDLPKAPAKIRITPRKNIKRHASSEPVAPVEESLVPLSDEIDVQPAVDTKPVPTPWKAMAQAAAVTMLAPNDGPPSQVEHFEMPSPKVPLPLWDFGGPETPLYAARERRNRLIRFGLSELAALVSLVLLGRFAFVHRSPDLTINVLFFILILAAAAAAVALPIMFIRNDPSRWQRE